MASISEHKHNFLCELPKCEHHVHLEGTLSPELLFRLANKNQIELPAHFPKSADLCYQRYNQFADLQDFLDHYYIGMSVLINESDFEDLAYEYFKKASNDGCKHCEAFFDPQGHVERGIPFEVVVNGFRNGCLKAENDFNISTKLIMCLLRHLPVNNCLETIENSKEFYEKGWIHGLGLDSSEKPFPPDLFIDCYKKINDEFPNVGLTAHAGEECGPDMIERSINLLNITRVDHGIQSYKDDELLKKLSNNKTMLTLCPISNLKLQVVNDLTELPIRKWIDNGISFSINSDDPAYFDGYLLDNYLAVEKHFSLSGPEWVQIAKNGVLGSWITDERKKQLCDEIDLVYNKYAEFI